MFAFFIIIWYDAATRCNSNKPDETIDGDVDHQSPQTCQKMLRYMAAAFTYAIRPYAIEYVNGIDTKVTKAGMASPT